MRNFAKDIISFANADGGIILIGIKEDNVNGIHEDLGLNEENLKVLSKIDLNDVNQQFNKILKTGISIDLQRFQISTRYFYYLIIQKSSDVLVPQNNYPDYKIYKGAIYYRTSGNNECANTTTSEFNRFLQVKANEKSKEFMEIWSKLLPEMVDINPKEVLIVNPIQDKVYGFNRKDKSLSGSNIEIEKSENGVFNIILNAISAGEIGKITDDYGKPIYKLVGEIYKNREHIILNSLEKAVAEKAHFKFTNLQLKAVIHYLGWTDSKSFAVVNPVQTTVNTKFNKFLWIETMDELTGRRKIYFSRLAIPELLEIVNNKDLHMKIFGKMLKEK